MGEGNGIMYGSGVTNLYCRGKGAHFEESWSPLSKFLKDIEENGKKHADY